MPLPPAKELVAEAEAGAGGLFKLWLRIMRILETQDKHAKLIEDQKSQIQALRDAVHTLQAREDVVLARAEKAAVQAASESVTTGLTDMSRRLGYMEGMAQGKAPPKGKRS